MNKSLTQTNKMNVSFVCTVCSIIVSYHFLCPSTMLNKTNV